MVPDYAPAQLVFSKLDVTEGKREEALARLNGIISGAEPADAAALYWRAVARGKATNTSSLAETDLRAAISRNPDFVPAYVALARLLAERPGSFVEALRFADQGVRRDASSSAAWMTLARIQKSLSQNAEAERCAILAVTAATNERDRNDAEALLSQMRVTRDRAEGNEEATPPSNPAANRTREPPDLKRGLRRRPSGEESRPWIAEGKVTGVSCSGQSLELEMETSEGTVRLRASNLLEPRYYRVGGGAANRMDPCKELPGQRVRAEYRLAGSPQPHKEILSLELLP
jgi:tetratricopeptide (TPR) repeat protein